MSTSAREVILGVGGYLGHDANAALLVDGALVAASQEERFTRRKHDGSFPHCAIHDCLAIAGLGPADVDVCVFAEKPFQTALFDRAGRPGSVLPRALGRLLPERTAGLYTVPARALLPRAQFRFAWHHISHVAGAFHTSPFSRAAFLCVDGKGEDYSASAGVISHGELKLLWEQPYENGLGMFYTLITYYLGFLSFGSEYKVMGLAPYGTPRHVAELSRLFTTDDRGGFRLRRETRFTWPSLMAALPWIAEQTGIPVREKSDPLDQVHIDLATSLQQIFEDEVLKMARFLRAETGEDNVLFCGGCAQNCVAAGKLRAQRIFSAVFNSPVGGDRGSGLGAARFFERQRFAGAPFKTDTQAYDLKVIAGARATVKEFHAMLPRSPSCPFTRMRPDIQKYLPPSRNMALKLVAFPYFPPRAQPPLDRIRKLFRGPAALPRLTTLRLQRVRDDPFRLSN